MVIKKFVKATVAALTTALTKKVAKAEIASTPRTTGSGLIALAHSRAAFGSLLAVLPMLMIWYVISERDVPVRYAPIAFSHDCNSELSAVLEFSPLYQEHRASDLKVTVYFNEWLTVADKCNYLEIEAPTELERFRAASMDDLKYRGRTVAEAMIGVSDGALSDYSERVVRDGFSGVNYKIADLSNFGGALQFIWPGAVYTIGFTKKVLVIEPLFKPKTYKSPINLFKEVKRIDNVTFKVQELEGYSLSESVPKPLGFQHYRENVFTFRVDDDKSPLTPNLMITFESSLRRRVRDALLIILSSAVALGMAIITEPRRGKWGRALRRIVEVKLPSDVV